MAEALHDSPFLLEQRLVDEGLASQPTAELLRILIGPDAAHAYVASGSLRRLLRSAAEQPLDLESRVRLAAFEALSARRLAEPIDVRKPLNDSTAVVLHFRHLALLEHEQFHLGLLDAKLRQIEARRIASGSANEVSFSSHEILRPAIALNAAALVVVHNHPSGDPRPSPVDLDVTIAIRRATEAIGVRFVDHVIVAAGLHAYSIVLQQHIDLGGGRS